MGLNFGYDTGQTPLDEDEKEGLLIPTIATRRELDEFEQQNIEQAMLWTRRNSKGILFYPKISQWICIRGCMVTYGNGQVSLERREKTLVWMFGKYQQL